MNIVAHFFLLENVKFYIFLGQMTKEVLFVTLFEITLIVVFFY